MTSFKNNVQINFVRRLLIDFTALFVCILPAFLIRSSLKSSKVGFFCGDQTIKYPFKESSISKLVLKIILILTPIVVIVFTELTKITFNSKSLKKYLFLVYYFVINFFTGLALVFIVVTISKFTINEKRPNFFSLCNPNVNCSSIDQNKLILDYKCLNDNDHFVNESYLSFISGHTAYFAYLALYLIVFIHHRMSTITFDMFKPIAQSAIFIFSLYVSLTRVSDYWHHSHDVLFGYMFGSLFAFFNVTHAMRVAFSIVGDE